LEIYDSNSTNSVPGATNFYFLAFSDYTLLKLTMADVNSSKPCDHMETDAMTEGLEAVLNDVGPDYDGVWKELCRR
jgi:hypothetical protein